MGNNLMPAEDQTTTTASEAPASERGYEESPGMSYHATTTGHQSAAVEDASNPVSGEGTHLEKAVAA